MLEDIFSRDLEK